MNYLSVCSGIEAATVAWHPLGWRPFAYSEIERFPCSVLAHHYPHTPNLGDMTKYQEWPDAAIDLLVGGTPCQSFSVAGLRKGLDDPRGNLMLTYGAIAGRYRPRWLVWENVPGVLSSNGGRDFGTLLGMLAELGYGFAYRILDAQYFGVAQRRRRVFVIGHLGEWRRAAAVLFERESLCGHPAPRRKAGEAIAPTIRAGAANGGAGHGARSGDSKDELIVPVDWPAEVASTLNAHYGDKQGLEDQHALGGGNSLSLPSVSLCLNAGAMGRLDAESETLIPAFGGVFDVAHTLKGDGFDASEDGTGRGTPIIPIAYGWQNSASQGDSASADVCPTLDKSKTPAIGVRRLTPVECERLQGFPDGYTDIRPRGKPTPDGPRYKALGNSMAVPCMRWIGERVAMVDVIQAKREAA
jgi:DNA (cytosine-5)-methyltransferase 1